MKKSILFFALFCFATVQIFAQNTIALHDAPTTISESKKVDKNIEIITESGIDFKKEEKMILQKIQKSVVYPELAYEYGVEGKVLIEVEFNGKIQNTKVVKSLGAGCDEAALKAIKEYENHFQKLDYKTKETKIFTVPVYFKLK